MGCFDDFMDNHQSEVSSVPFFLAGSHRNGRLKSLTTLNRRFYHDSLDDSGTYGVSLISLPTMSPGLVAFRLTLTTKLTDSKYSNFIHVYSTIPTVLQLSLSPTLPE